ncbi:replication restart helicase PriA [Thalassoglobus sp.]|uniref:replication restart helicase PriA n=1 Tax=Thalassoglobus sp. TaxID=2795869 RepID=UPI003AA86E6B
MSPKHQKGLFQLEPEPAPWELAAGADLLAAQVVFNRPLDTVYHYLVPEPLREMIEPGQRVKVPFGRGNTPTLGYCVGLTSEISTSKRLKSITEVLDRQPLLSQQMLDLTQWIADRYLSSWGQVLESVVPAGVKRQAGTREVVFYRIAPDLTDLESLKLPKKQHAVMQILAESEEALRVDALAEAAECGTSPIDSLRKKRLIVPERRRMNVNNITEMHVEHQEDLKLNGEQQSALDAILKTIRASEYETILLHGVTGSGKTEVYIQAIREIVSYGQQAIVLVPEISLTPQTIRRFRARFDNVAVLHSHLSDADRHWHWQQIAQGEVQVIVGARSAIFAPTPHLGLIIIDEEHESTFKQHSTPRYHAREVARERARREGIPLILGTATPTLESLVRTIEGHDKLIVMKDRVEQRPLPPVTIVDVRHDPLIQRRHSLGRALTNAMQQALNSGGQVILFLNLRGFSPVLWCPKCTGIRCPDCDVTLTWHKDRGRLLCHSCEYEIPPPERCPNCGQPGMRFLGAGTQRLEDEVKSKFPGMRLVRMDSDSMRKPGSHDEALTAFREGEVDILLGTQMIAKGLDFPNVTLVGVIDADSLLHQPDLRAAERTFQLIAQVAGRTGRGEKEGRVLVQTMNPDEPVIQFAAHHDYYKFASYELKQRKMVMAPPYRSMARVILRSLDEEVVAEEAKRIVKFIRSHISEKKLPVRVLGPAPAPITRLRKYFRYHFQMTSDQIQTIQDLWREIVPYLKIATDVELTIDVDPVDLR